MVCDFGASAVLLMTLKEYVHGICLQLAAQPAAEGLKAAAAAAAAGTHRSGGAGGW